MARARRGGVELEEARTRAVRVGLGERCAAPVIGLDELIANELAAGRPQDLADAAALERIRSKRR